MFRHWMLIGFLACCLSGCIATRSHSDLNVTPTTQPASQPGDPPTLTRDERLGAMDFRHVVSQAKDKVFPAVVYIKCLREDHESGKKIVSEVSGSGVIISDDGQMLTNWHVVDKAVEVRCLLYDGRAMEAKVLGSDKDTDLALVQLQLAAGEKIVSAELGDSTTLREGDFVMAMGAPWGLSRSVSIGIVSCMRRFLPGHSEYSLWLQTDAAISPGNSGGPLVDTRGQVVGINTRGVMYGGDMGFAIPSATIKHLVPQLREHGRMTWSWTGLQLQPIRDFERNVFFEGDEGVIVAETDQHSPGRQAGLLSRDRILSINGQPCVATTEEDLPALRITIGLLEKNKPAQLVVLRGNEQQTLTLTPCEKGCVEGDELDCPRWDMTVKSINQFANPGLYWHRNNGVFVFGVKYPGNAQSAGLQAEDIITQVDGRGVTTLDDLKTIHGESLKNITSGHRLRLTVLRNGLMRQVVMDISRDHEKE